jgi:hypothetical protein
MSEHAERPTSRSISDSVDDHLTAIDALVRGLQAATGKYRGRPLDWSDVASLSQVREHLGSAVKGFSTAETAATLHRAARQVATEVRRFRPPDGAANHFPVAVDAAED